MKSLQSQIDTLKQQVALIEINSVHALADLEKRLKASTSQSNSSTSSADLSEYLKISTVIKLGASAALTLYCQKTISSSRVSKLSYTKALRHLHLVMGVGIVGGIGSVQIAKQSEGREKRKWLDIHKGSGVLMLVGFFLRVVLRLRSPIPERFPGPKVLKVAETSSHYLFYLIMLLLPSSGMAYTFWNGSGIPLLNISKTDIDEDDMVSAQRALDIHVALGKFMEYVWLPFHFASLGYHSSKGRSVVKRITPFP